MQVYRFGEFELDLEAQQLRSGGKPVRLERRPFDLLVLLVGRQGRLVSRDEIISALWPPGIIIDFDSGLNTLVRKVRNALGDSAEEPKFIETVPGRGYRFIVPPEASAPADAEPRQTVPAKRRQPRLAILFAAAIVAAGAVIFWRSDFMAPGQIRIAVLPFENLTGDEKLGYLASGIAEETNLSLAMIDAPSLSVIGIVSARALANSPRPLQQIGSELGVDFVVASSLRLDQSRIRVTSRLIRIADGEQLWSASFDRELTNVLGLQRELSVAIAEQIRQRLSPAVAALIESRQTQNPEAYELYLRGRHEWARFQPDSVSRALQYYEEAVAKDPGYALAWAGIAHALITSVVTTETSRMAVKPAAGEALQKALEYGPGLAETQLALGTFHLFLSGDRAAAESAARRAVDLDPNSAMANMFLGLVLAGQDRHVEAREMLRRARELDPLFPLMFANSAVVALAADEPSEALELATQAVAIAPEFWVGHLHLGSALLALGNYDAALNAFANAEKLSGRNSTRAVASQAYVLTRLGRYGEARDVLEDLLDKSATQYVSPYYIALIHAALGELDPAFEWLDRLVASRDVSCLYAANNAMFESLWADLRFEVYMNRCRLALEPGDPAQ